MKRKYEKPQLIKEKFTVGGVLASCAYINALPSKAENCAYGFDEESGLPPVFYNGWVQCKREPSGGVDSYCYFTPENTNIAIFSS